MLDVRELTNILFSAPKGCSIDVNGDEPTTGYMVGGFVPALVLSPKEPRQGHPEDWRPMFATDEWIGLHYGKLETGVNYVGIWTDSADGKVYLDISRNEQDLATALAIADNFGEIAIWDVENKREIRLSDN